MSEPSRVAFACLPDQKSCSGRGRNIGEVQCLAWFFNSPTQQGVAFSSRGRSKRKRVSAMTRKVIILEFVAPTVLAVVLGIVLSAGAVYLTNRYLGPVDQSEANHSVAGSRGVAELPNPDGRLSRVHLLLSSMK
jgi:hypothetical protein